MAGISPAIFNFGSDNQENINPYFRRSGFLKFHEVVIKYFDL